MAKDGRTHAETRGAQATRCASPAAHLERHEEVRGTSGRVRGDLAWAPPVKRRSGWDG
jgi:hypothetical protein